MLQIPPSVPSLLHWKVDNVLWQTILCVASEGFQAYKKSYPIIKDLLQKASPDDLADDDEIEYVGALHVFFKTLLTLLQQIAEPPKGYIEGGQLSRLSYLTCF